MIDREKLLRLFTGPALEPLLARLRRRLELGHPLTGTLVLSKLSAQQTEAVGALVGRSPAATGDLFVSVPLDELEANLVAAGLCGSLRAAVEFLTGPVANLATARDERDAAWAHVVATAPTIFQRPPLAAWLDELHATGLLKRSAESSPVTATALLTRLARVVAALPAGGEPLASFAAAILGDAHALDPGRPLTTLALRAAARLTDLPPAPDSTESRRAVWAAVGVMCDELSAPVLVLNLPSAAETPLARLLRTAASAGEPLHLTLRLLLRSPLAHDPALAGLTIFVCENPTIVALAAAMFGPACAPLICVNGQFATPALILLRQLRTAGARLHYHGDFDPPGLVIARRVFAESGAAPWRYSAADYLAAPPGEEFSGHVGPTPWSPDLAPAMSRLGRVVHEEAVFADLARDLAHRPA